MRAEGPRETSSASSPSALAFTLVFFLSRAWLAEPNVVLVLAPVLVLAALGRVDRRLFTALWAIPLVFTVINASPVQLLWVAAPGAMARSLAWWASYGDVTLAARAALVVAWQIAGWWTVVVCLRRQRLSAEECVVAGADEAAGANGPADARDLKDASCLGGRAREALP